MERPDYWRIHKLEYDLGFREDPPPQRHTDEPGSIIYWDPEWEARPTYFTISDCRFGD